MFEQATDSGINVGIPLPSDEELFAFEEIVLESDLSNQNVLSVHHMWQEIISTRPLIQKVMQGSLISRRLELDLDDEFVEKEHLEMVCDGFKLAVGQVIYTYFFRSKIPLFEDFLKSAESSGLLPLESLDEYIHVERTLAEEKPFIEETGKGSWDQSIAYRDMVHLMREAEDLLKLIENQRDFRLKQFDHKNSNYSVQEIEELELSFDFGYETAIEMFVQSYEYRILMHKERDLLHGPFGRMMLELATRLEYTE